MLLELAKDEGGGRVAVAVVLLQLVEAVHGVFRVQPLLLTPRGLPPPHEPLIPGILDLLPDLVSVELGAVLLPAELDLFGDRQAGGFIPPVMIIGVVLDLSPPPVLIGGQLHGGVPHTGGAATVRAELHARHAAFRLERRVQVFWVATVAAAILPGAVVPLVADAVEASASRADLLLVDAHPSQGAGAARILADAAHLGGLLLQVPLIEAAQGLGLTVGSAREYQIAIRSHGDPFRRCSGLALS